MEYFITYIRMDPPPCRRVDCWEIDRIAELRKKTCYVSKGCPEADNDPDNYDKSTCNFFKCTVDCPYESATKCDAKSPFNCIANDCPLPYTPVEDCRCSVEKLTPKQKEYFDDETGTRDKSGFLPQSDEELGILDETNFEVRNNHIKLTEKYDDELKSSRSADHIRFMKKCQKDADRVRTAYPDKQPKAKSKQSGHSDDNKKYETIVDTLIMQRINEIVAGESKKLLKVGEIVSALKAMKEQDFRNDKDATLTKGI